MPLRSAANLWIALLFFFFDHFSQRSLLQTSHMILQRACVTCASSHVVLVEVTPSSGLVVLLSSVVHCQSFVLESKSKNTHKIHKSHRTVFILSTSLRPSSFVIIFLILVGESIRNNHFYLDSHHQFTHTHTLQPSFKLTEPQNNSFRNIESK